MDRPKYVIGLHDHNIGTTRNCNRTLRLLVARGFSSAMSMLEFLRALQKTHCSVYQARLRYLANRAW